MAAWIIGYGVVQAAVPKLLKNTRSAAGGARAARAWGIALALLPALLAVALNAPLGGTDVGIVLIAGLFVFGSVFAVNSAVHSFLIIAYSDHDKVALNVGFYYMANAVGRLMGTLLSGLIYQMAGLTACLVASAVMLVIASVLTLGLPMREAGTDCSQTNNEPPVLPSPSMRFWARAR